MAPAIVSSTARVAGPEIRITARALRPGGVASAKMVSWLFVPASGIGVLRILVGARSVADLASLVNAGSPACSTGRPCLAMDPAEPEDTP